MKFKWWMLLPAFFVFGGAGYKRKRRRRGFRKRRFRYKRYSNWRSRNRMNRKVYRRLYGGFRPWRRRPSRRRFNRTWRSWNPGY